MRIAHIGVGSVPVMHRFGGGVERRIRELARVQAERGHEVIIYSAGDATERTRVGGVELRAIACRSGRRLSWIEIQVRAAAELRGERIDVIHYHNQPEGAAISRPSAAATFLSYDYFYFRRGLVDPLYRRLLNAFDGLLAVSRYCLEESQRYWRFNSGKGHVVYNGVNIQQFRPDAMAGQAERHALGLAKRPVLYVGRVNEQKGVDLLIEACQRLNAERDDLQLVVAGPIGQFDQAQIGASPWQTRIEAVGGVYLGPVAEDRLAALYNMADVFVMPTREFEMFGMAAVEAQACGTPVVASDHGGLRETVPTACGGRFAVGDADDLARQIARLLDDQDAYARATAGALANAARYDWAVVDDGLEALYRGTQRP